MRPVRSAPQLKMLTNSLAIRNMQVCIFVYVMISVNEAFVKTDLRGI